MRLIYPEFFITNLGFYLPEKHFSFFSHSQCSTSFNSIRLCIWLQLSYFSCPPEQLRSQAPAYTIRTNPANRQRGTHPPAFRHATHTNNRTRGTRQDLMFPEVRFGNSCSRHVFWDYLLSQDTSHRTNTQTRLTQHYAGAQTREAQGERFGDETLQRDRNRRGTQGRGGTCCTAIMHKQDEECSNSATCSTISTNACNATLVFCTRQPSYRPRPTPSGPVWSV